MPQITADYIYTPEGFVSNHFLKIDQSGTILHFGPITPEISIDQSYEGVLIPGFINTHCHLELSMLKGQIPRGSGMTGFVFQVVTQRGKFSEAEQNKAVEQAMREAWQSGTVAIGDICNSPISAQSKRDFPELFTHSFIELLGLNKAQAETILQKGKETAETFFGLSHSLTLHAPYSMSEQLIEAIYQENPALISVHLLESKEERDVFEQKKGPFLDFYEKLGIPFSGFSTPSPIDYVLKKAPREMPILSIHNTEMSQEEVNQIAADFPNLFFTLCPRANQYIHETLPEPGLFHRLSDRVCVGTDSLASNDSLDILEELKTLWRQNDWLNAFTLTKWATTNGARAMGLSDKFGTFTQGTRPGINWLLDLDLRELYLTEESRIEKLF